jgi:hypothetical protein
MVVLADVALIAIELLLHRADPAAGEIVLQSHHEQRMSGVGAAAVGAIRPEADVV